VRKFLIAGGLVLPALLFLAMELDRKWVDSFIHREQITVRPTPHYRGRA